MIFLPKTYSILFFSRSTKLRSKLSFLSIGKLVSFLGKIDKSRSNVFSS
ncbi:Uncharacterised protein [Mesomycoplasma hyorhinis]|nr:Uncharacterised protein [Mesomycoplasma hyorhinis]